jgi:hypothetical protein
MKKLALVFLALFMFSGATGCSSSGISQEVRSRGNEAVRITESFFDEDLSLTETHNLIISIFNDFSNEINQNNEFSADERRIHSLLEEIIIATAPSDGIRVGDELTPSKLTSENRQKVLKALSELRIILNK